MTSKEKSLEVFLYKNMEQKRYFASGAVALGSEHTSFSFVGSLSIKFLVTSFLSQSNLPLFAPFLYKVGTWTLPHFCASHKKPNEQIESVRSLPSREKGNNPFRIIPSSIFWFCAPFLPFPTLSNCESRSKLQRKRCSTCFS